MRTLAPWIQRLPSTLREIHCPEMKLFVGRDHRPPVLVGFGSLHWDRPTAPHFTMSVHDDCSGEGFSALVRFQRDPENHRNAFMLEVTDHQGTDWHCGWVAPEVEASTGTLRLRGSLNRITTHPAPAQVCTESSVELYFEPAPRVPLAEGRTTTVKLGNDVVAEKFEDGRQVFDVLGSRIEVSLDPWTDGLWIVASTSKDLSHPYFENWASEPLRILCGQLAYPRMIARNQGGGRAHVSLQRTCSLHSCLGGLRAEFDGRDSTKFWDFYQKCLRFLACHRGPDGYPLFEANPLSRFHEEVVQAAGSSDWVLALAASCAIEGVCRLAAGSSGLPKEFDSDAIEQARVYLRAATSPPKLVERLVSSVGYMGQPSIRKFLGNLVDKRVISSGHFAAWVSVRNKAAHGNLDGSGSPHEDHRNLVLLIQLLNTLTTYVVSQADATLSVKL
jgi:hypothetical protein